MSERPDHCPDCQSSRVAEIKYGLFALDDPDFRRELREERIVLGGDAFIVEECRDWRCMACGHEWGVEVLKRWEEGERKWEAGRPAREAAEAARAAEEDAAGVRRGVMEAVLDPNGWWTCCPYCGREFSIYNKNSWDGEIHLRCRTRLRVVQPPAGTSEKDE